MKRIVAIAAIASLLAAPLAAADPPRGWVPPGHRGPPPVHGHHYVPYHPGRHYVPYYPRRHYVPYHYGRHKGNGDSDDAAWAIGGLVVGAVIGTAAAKAEYSQAQQAVQVSAATPLPPPQKRKVVTCYDEVAYDSRGDAYVARQCYENWR